MDISEQIEAYLIDRSDWVSASEICKRFGVRERALRQLGNRIGFCSRFAISHPRKGLKHVAAATTTEYLHAKHAMTRHAISELRRKASWDRRRHEVTRESKKSHIIFEPDTGQILMPGII